MSAIVLRKARWHSPDAQNRWCRPQTRPRTSHCCFAQRQGAGPRAGTRPCQFRPLHHPSPRNGAANPILDFFIGFGAPVRLLEVRRYFSKPLQCPLQTLHDLGRNFIRRPRLGGCAGSPKPTCLSPCKMGGMQGDFAKLQGKRRLIKVEAPRISIGLDRSRAWRPSFHSKEGRFSRQRRQGSRQTAV